MSPLDMSDRLRGIGLDPVAALAAPHDEANASRGAAAERHRGPGSDFICVSDTYPLTAVRSASAAARDRAPAAGRAC